MANSNRRSKERDTFHHVGSRIAHKVYFLEEGERNDFIEMARRVAVFTGIQLVGWCIMANHFHLLLYLPLPEEVAEEEVLRRYGILKGVKAADLMREAFAKWRLTGEAGESQVQDWLSAQRKRMYSVPSYMKILKQWFTEEYNRRHSHVGTLWETEYYDRGVAPERKELAKRLAYIHLNPIRAAIASSFDGYVWSSWTAFRRGDDVALAGLRLVYGDEMPIDEIGDMHTQLMEQLLEEEKRKRAEAIALKRAAGYEVPCDTLTNEALVAQAAVHLEQVRRESMLLREMRNAADVPAKERKAALRDEVRNMIRLHPDFTPSQLMEALDIPQATIYRILKSLQTDKTG